MSLPVRELLAGYLQKRHDAILRRLMTQVQSTPDLDELRALSHNSDYQQSVGTLMMLLIRNIADPGDRRAFAYFNQRASERFRQNIPAMQMLRIIGMHRQILHKMVARQFADEPDVSRRMTEIIDEQFSELELTLANSYQSQRDERWRVSETKYFALFENASEAILSFRPGEGLIIEANMQCARLLGCERGALLDMPFAELFTPEHREQAQWLVEHQSGTSNVRVEDMTVRRSDGMTVPVSLSCNWSNIEGLGGIAQIIMRDITQLRQMQRELRDYADQLETRVAERTHELQQSQENYRSLFLQEQRRAQHLSLVNTISKYSLENIRAATLVTSLATSQVAQATPEISQSGEGSISAFLHSVAQAIQTHFADCDVTIYLCESDYADLLESRNASRTQPPAPDECGDLIVAAQAGGNGLSPPPGTRHPFGQGLVGAAATSGEVVLVSHDVPTDERYVRPPGTHRDAISQLCVPVLVEETVIGVISLQAKTEDSFEQRDAAALQTVAGIMAGHLQASRVLREMRDLSQFHQSLTNTMLHSLVVTGWGETIRVVNERFLQTMRVERETTLGRPLEEFLGEAMARNNLREKMREVRATGTSHELQDVHVRVRPVGQPDYGLVFDVRMFRIYFRGEPQVAVLMINVTARWRREQEMRLMNETGRLFQSSLDVDTVLHAVLTCMTAGSALGFNRAFVFLREENSDLLHAARALGPSSYDEAQHIWWELSQQQVSLQDLLEASPADAPRTPLQEHVADMTLDLSNPTLPTLATVIREGRALKVTPTEMFLSPEEVFEGQRNNEDNTTTRRDDEFRREYLMAKELFTAPEIAIAPLVAKDRVVGAVLADNLYSGAQIDYQALQTLETLAHQAGLAIDNARTYRALQRAQNDLLSADRLVVIGELAARISHEIRNPLATIGGWAHNLQRSPGNTADVTRKAGIIVEEVNRLEGLLTDVLGMAKARPLILEPQQINEIIERALLLADADIRANKAEVVKDFGNLPPIMVDRSRILQALLNLIRNAAQSMSDKPDGTIYLSTRISEPPESVRTSRPDAPPLIEIEVRDEGRGITPQTLKQVFDPFFSTRLSGSGLGLAVTRRIMQDHEGEISVESQVGVGTSFVLILPLRPVPEDTESLEKSEEKIF